MLGFITAELSGWKENPCTPKLHSSSFPSTNHVKLKSGSWPFHHLVTSCFPGLNLDSHYQFDSQAYRDYVTKILNNLDWFLVSFYCLQRSCVKKWIFPDLTSQNRWFIYLWDEFGQAWNEVYIRKAAVSTRLTGATAWPDFWDYNTSQCVSAIPAVAECPPCAEVPLHGDLHANHAWVLIQLRCS